MHIYLSPELCGKKIEIMFFELGKLCVTKVKLSAKLCANITKKCIFLSFYIHFACIFIKNGEDQKSPNLLKVHILTKFYLT